MKINQHLVMPNQIGKPDESIPCEYDQAYWDWSEKLDQESRDQLDRDMESDSPPF